MARGEMWLATDDSQPCGQGQRGKMETSQLLGLGPPFLQQFSAVELMAVIS